VVTGVVVMVLVVMVLLLLLVMVMDVVVMVVMMTLTGPTVHHCLVKAAPQSGLAHWVLAP